MRKSVIIIAIILMSIGFAVISTTLVINGNIKVSENEEDFSVIFTAASIDGNDVYNSVIDDTKKIITFETSNLSKIGDKSILTYEITNNSSNYDANVSVTCVSKTGTTKYTSIINKLENDTKKVASKRSVNGSLTITLNKTPIEETIEEYTCKLDFTAIERDTLGKNIPEPVSFETDSWETIQKAVQKGNTAKYSVGDTKKVTIASHTNDCSSITGSGADYVCNSSVEPEKVVTVRISNMSKCTNGETSETACGFVVEFVDIIENHNYNKADATNTNGTNKGGWRDSEMRAYINGTLYNSFPSQLQNVIVSTKVISGYGNIFGETNFETQDKLYLLSTKEIYNTSQFDTIEDETRQLDFYSIRKTDVTNNDEVIKKYNIKPAFWWLRSAYSSYTHDFIVINSLGTVGNNRSLLINGISLAFRIA